MNDQRWEQLLHIEACSPLFAPFGERFNECENVLWRMGNGTEKDPVRAAPGAWIPTGTSGIITIKNLMWKKLLMKWGAFTQIALHSGIAPFINPDTCAGMSRSDVLVAYALAWQHVHRMLRVGIIEIVGEKTRDIEVAVACADLLWIPMFFGSGELLLQLLPTEIMVTGVYLDPPATVMGKLHSLAWQCAKDCAAAIGRGGDGELLLSGSMHLSMYHVAYFKTIQDSLPSIGAPQPNMDFDSRFRQNLATVAGSGAAAQSTASFARPHASKSGCAAMLALFLGCLFLLSVSWSFHGHEREIFQTKIHATAVGQTMAGPHDTPNAGKVGGGVGPND